MSTMKKHPTYKNGSGRGHRAYLSKKPREETSCCSDCKNTQNLEVHHKDKNPKNNKLSNLQVLCRKCHAKKHYKCYSKEERRKRNIMLAKIRREKARKAKKLLIKTILQGAKYFSAKDIEKHLGVTRETIRLWRIAGKYRYKKIGGRYYYFHLKPKKVFSPV